MFAMNIKNIRKKQIFLGNFLLVSNLNIFTLALNIVQHPRILQVHEMHFTHS